MFAGRVKIVSHSSCKTVCHSAILKYFCPLCCIYFMLTCRHSYLVGLGLKLWLCEPTSYSSFVYTSAGFYRTQYPASYTHKSLGRTRQFTLPASTGTQMCLLCLSLKSQIPKLFRNDSSFPIFTGYL